MMYLLMSSFTIITSIMFFKMTHPLSLGLTLLLQTLNMCIMVGMISKTFWFSFILFLILLGGMLVLFMYIVSLAPNEKFSLSKNFFILLMMTYMIISLIWFLMDKTTFLNMQLNKEMETITNKTSFLPENILSLNKLYNPPTFFMTIMLINYLLMTLIIIIHITKTFFGPLRTKMLKN